MTKKLMRMTLTLAIMLLMLTVVRPLEVEAMPRPARIYGWTTTDMCLRSYPGLGGDIVAVVPRGAEVVVVSTDDNPVDGFHWAYVRYPDVEGYMAYVNQSQSMKFLEFQQWNPVEGSSGWVRLLREVTFSAGPNPELSGGEKLEPGRELYVQTEMSPVRQGHGTNICHVWVDGIEGYIPANNSAVMTYEYMAVPNDMSYIPATAPTTSEPVNERGIVTKAMNLRQYPTKNSEIFMRLNTYEEVWVESLETTVSGDKWYRVNTGTEGFIAAEGILVGQTLDRYARTSTDVNLRSGPSTNSQILVTIPNGYKLWAVTRFNGVGNSSQNPNWVHISVRLNGVKTDGYVVDWAIK